MTQQESIAEEVRALEGLELEGLRSEWRRRYGAPPTLRSTDLLARLLAWRIQAEAFGGLDSETRSTLFRKSLPVAAPTLAPGMRLERSWRGTKQTVEVVEDGFRWEGRSYSSLSQVAHAITGVKWNGPRFFGLRQEPG
jgi:hypothetical protein